MYCLTWPQPWIIVEFNMDIVNYRRCTLQIRKKKICELLILFCWFGESLHQYKCFSCISLFLCTLCGICTRNFKSRVSKISLSFNVDIGTSVTVVELIIVNYHAVTSISLLPVPHLGQLQQSAGNSVGVDNCNKISL